VQERLGIVLDYTFHVPLLELGADYLERRLMPLLPVAAPGRLIDDSELTVVMRPVELGIVQRRLRDSLIRLDGTGLFRDMFGFEDPARGITFALQAEPDPETPRYAREISWGAASIWSCDAAESIRAKAQHFRRQLTDATEQLPAGHLGFVHIGAEAYDGEGVEMARYERLTA